MTEKQMFILGGTGFIGSETVREAVASGWKVVALVRREADAAALRALGAVPVLGTAQEVDGWFEQAQRCSVIVDLVQPQLPRRVRVADIESVSLQRQAITRALTSALSQVPIHVRPLLVSASGLDDLVPDREGNVSVRSELSPDPKGFGRIGVFVRRIIEGSGVAATHVYLGTVYGPGKSFAATVFPSLMRGRFALPAPAKSRFPVIHVKDAARALVHLASLPRESLVGRSWLLVDESGGAPLGTFFDTAARLLGVAPPARLPAWLLSLAIGRALVETLTRDLAAKPEALSHTGFRFQYPTAREGLPPTLEDLGYRAGAARRPKNFWTWALVSIALLALVSENAFSVPLSVPGLRELAGGRSILDMRPGYGTREVSELLTALGALGRSRYLTLLWTIDLVLPALFSSALFRLVALGRLRAWRTLALAPGAFDYFENLAVTFLLLGGPAPDGLLVQVASALTVLKLGLYGACVLLALLGALPRSPKAAPSAIGGVS